MYRCNRGQFAIWRKVYQKEERGRYIDSQKHTHNSPDRALINSIKIEDHVCMIQKILFYQNDTKQ